jgi:hypothetical protein
VRPAQRWGAPAFSFRLWDCPPRLVQGCDDGATGALSLGSSAWNTWISGAFSLEKSEI